MDVMTGTEWKNRRESDDWLRYRADVEAPLAQQGELVLRDYLVPAETRRVLDIGCGAGRLIDVIRERFPDVTAIGLDLSPDMVEQARNKFGADGNTTFAAHDLMDHLPKSLGTFDAIVSSLAIHHLPHDRKAELYGEAYSLLNPGGTLCDLDCDKMPSKRLKKMFRTAHKIDRSVRHPSDQPATRQLKLDWLEAAGFEDVQCHWNCLGMSLVGGRRPEQGT
jgi:tRNA (cmo5U34)-methyltransferase